MSMISFVICALCLVSTLSAIPSPGMVFSAVIRNSQNAPVECVVGWGTFSTTVPINVAVTIESNQHTVINEKIVDMGTWSAAAFIEEINCGDLKLVAPFPKVTRTQRCWQFLVEPNKLTSVGPGSCVQ